MQGSGSPQPLLKRKVSWSYPPSNIQVPSALGDILTFVKKQNPDTPEAKTQFPTSCSSLFLSRGGAGVYLGKPDLQGHKRQLYLDELKRVRGLDFSCEFPDRIFLVKIVIVIANILNECI